MCEAKVVADGVGHVAGQDVGLEGVDVDADADGADSADATHVGDGCLTRLVAPTTATITAVIVYSTVAIFRQQICADMLSINLFEEVTKKYVKCTCRIESSEPRDKFSTIKRYTHKEKAKKKIFYS